MAPILVLGDVTRDLLGAVSWAAQQGELAVLEPLVESIGGKAYNTARLLASLGVRSTLGTVVGDDLAATGFLQQSHGTLQMACIVEPSKAASRFVQFRHGAQVQTYYAPGVELGQDPKHLLELERWLMDDSEYGVVYLAVNHLDFLREALVRVSERAKTVVSIHSLSYEEAGHQVREILTLADWLVGNQDEVAALEQRLESSTEQWVKVFNLEIVIETLGSAGCRLHAPGTVASVPASPAQLVDPTGAGDAFLAGFLAAFGQGNDPVRAAAYAARLGALAVSRWGPLHEVISSEKGPIPPL